MRAILKNVPARRLPARAMYSQSRGRADDQLWLQNDLFNAGRHLGREYRQRNPRGFLANSMAALIDTRKRHPESVVVVKVAATDQGNVIGNP